MQIENYSERYLLDVVNLVENFHNEYLTVFKMEREKIESTVKSFEENAQNSFLLIIDGKCEGLLAGVEIKNNLSSQRIFQEIIWYVNKPFGKYGIKLVKYAEKNLKAIGFSIMIMAVLESQKIDKIKSIYKRIGYSPLETHFIRTL